MEVYITHGTFRTEHSFDVAMGPLPDARCYEDIGPGVVSIGVGHEENVENVASFGVNIFWYFCIC